VKILSIALTLCLFVSVTHSIEAAGKSKKKTPAAVVDTSDKISAVHLASITVSVHSPPSSKEYKVNAATKITVNGQPAQLSGLGTGMDVVVALAPDGVTAAAIDAKTAKH